MSTLALVPLISFLAYVALVVVVVRHPRPHERGAFSLYLVLAGCWSLLSFVIRLETPLIQEHTLSINKLLILCMLCGLLAYYYFVRVFVGKGPGLGVILGVVFILGIAVLAVLGFVPRQSFSSDGLLYVDFGFSIYPLAIIGLTMVGACAFFLVQERRTSTHGLSRTRVTYLLIGLGAVALGGLTNVSEGLSKYPIDHIGNLINALVISYAILKYQLLEIRIVLRRGLPYSILTVSLTTVYLLSLYGLQNIFHSFAGVPGFVVAAGLAMLMAAGFAPLRNLIQDRVDRLFFRESYELRRMVVNFRSTLVYSMDVERLGESILSILLNGLNANRASLLLPNDTTGDFHNRLVLSSNSSSELSEFVIHHGSPLLTTLERDAQVIQMEVFETLPEAKGLWEEERYSMGINEVSLLCPLVSRGKVVGVLALGDKKRRGKYTAEELDILLTMASWAALALDNAEVLDNLRRQQRRAEQLLAQVLQGQEKEREWIALELHDSVAQELVWASYQAQICRTLLEREQGVDLQTELNRVSDAVDGSLRELRRVLSGLRPPAIDELGLTDALQQLTDELGRMHIDSHFSIKGFPVRLEPSVEISVYRIVQEAISNVRRHAEASRVDVQLQFYERQLMIEITDNGKGFRPAEMVDESMDAGKIGLNGMKQRAEWLGGSLLVKSHKNRGTRIMVQIPMPLLKAGDLVQRTIEL